MQIEKDIEMKKIIDPKSIRAAFYYSMPFQLRTLEPIAAEFETVLFSSRFEEIKDWRPSVLFTSDAAQIPNLRPICDSNNTILVGLRHGVANKYIPTEKEYSLADYVCGSNWDKKDFEESKVFPRKDFLITGNPWIDDVFKIANRELNEINPTLLFAPTYNPEVSAAVFLKDDLVKTIRKVYPQSKIIIKPHPAILDYDHFYVTEHKELFKELVNVWKKNVEEFENVYLIEDSKKSISDFYSETDILISDGSSLVFEFMALNRPILLYTSNEKVKIWNHIYDENALANSRRNVGSEFSTKEEFEISLKDVFSLHRNNCSKFQLEYSKEIFGEFIDGNSFKRVAEAIKGLLVCRLKTWDARLIAMYLPQYHPIQENDKAWGKGFTEWTNVAKAKPLFPNHYQPHLPTELGFYDLRLDEVRKEQIELAKKYGIFGFCYYYYWFSGKSVLETPIIKLLQNKELNFPFCICWANENWTKKWDGHSEDIILQQEHRAEDDYNFIKELIPFFKDSRYITIDNKPILLIYRTELFPNIKQSSETWRRIARENGINDLYLIRVEGFQKGIDPINIGFDAALEFAPDWTEMGTRIDMTGILDEETKSLQIYDYRTLVKNMLAREKESYKLFRSVTPSWDNTARREKNATVFVNSSPELYKEWLAKTIMASSKVFNGDENIVFVNAWNEWAEGNHLEPDIKYGNKFLEATAEALNNYEVLNELSIESNIICEENEISNNLENQKMISQIRLNEVKSLIDDKSFFEAFLLLHKLQNEDPNNEEIIKSITLLFDEIIILKKQKKWSSRNSTELIVKAEAFIEKQQLNKAKENLISVLNFEPEHIEALNDLTVICILESNIDYAVKLIDLILKLENENEIALGNYNYLVENNLLSPVKMNNGINSQEYDSKIQEELNIYKNQEIVHNLPPVHSIYTGKALSKNLIDLTGKDNFWDWCAIEIDRLIENKKEMVYGVSIGCGNGDSEIEVIKRVKNKNLFTFVGIDINPTMVERGNAFVKENKINSLSFVTGDFNSLKLDRKYDFVFANHSLHHVVELENLFEAILRYSTDDMIFMINDMIGRNGHVMWDGTKQAVDIIWIKLDKKYKLNAYTKLYDKNVLNHDCSNEGFEGIRAQDILPLLIKYFDYNVYIPFSVIISRFIDRAYGHNFDVNNPEDLKKINNIIDSDVKILKDKKLSPTQAIMKFVKKGKSVNQQYVFMTPEETINTRNKFLDDEHLLLLNDLYLN